MKPSLKEVKKYLKNAKSIKCLEGREEIDLKETKIDYKWDNNVFLDSHKINQTYICIWNTSDGFAQIEYKSNKPKQMKLKKKQQKFIKKAYNSNDVCQQWKDDIKKNFPELFKDTDLVVGEWYKLIGGIYDWMGCYQSNKNHEFSGYGFSLSDNEWEQNLNLSKLESRELIPATKEEIETALI